VKRIGLKRSGLALGSLGLAAAAVAVAGPASAATPQRLSIGGGRIQLCAEGNYAAWFAYQGSSTGDLPEVAEGTCQTFNLPQVGDMVVQVFGHFNTSDGGFLIGALPGLVNPNGGGWSITTFGTTGDGGADAGFSINQFG